MKTSNGSFEYNHLIHFISIRLRDNNYKKTIKRKLQIAFIRKTF